ncbi:uncharacterized protein B0P05DRAFT_572394 [Gilbertella persicaria]|uniref:uncharacterized protein n=1 Tax=Gilbertella persicaria TaxID=101096 RepID=UPI002220F0A1|nr:uncharacterized protein B0P05DRAFT_572394 [Gilbertella persicaria]KAI8076408.1 hypothetical protein B0P05DRAFT_572394 [Gilbertella persicaria]
MVSALKQLKPELNDDASCLETNPEEWMPMLNLIKTKKSKKTEDTKSEMSSTTATSTTFSGLKRDFSHIKIEEFQTDFYRSSDQWLVGDKNILGDFKKFQDESLEMAKRCKGTMLLKNDIAVLLSLSGILILSKDIQHPVLNNCFNTIKYSTLVDLCCQEFLYHLPLFPLQSYVAYSAVVQKLLNDGYDYREEFQEEMMMMKKKEDGPQKKILDALIHIAPEVVKPLKKKVSELDLCASFVQPFVGRLLQERNNDPHQSDRVVDELEEVDAKCRPNIKCLVYEGENYIFTNAYGEVKPSNIYDKHLLNFELYKLALYGKEMLQKSDAKNILCFQIWGGAGKAYIMKLACNNVCTITHFCDFRIPVKLKDMDMSLNDMNNLMKFVYVYKKYCFEKQSSTEKFLMLPSLSLPLATLFDIISSEASNKKRKLNE